MANEKRLIDAINKEMPRLPDTNYKLGYSHGLNKAKDIVLKLDAVEVVRCGECRFVDTKKCPMSGSDGRVSASDFCSYGERKDKDA